MSKNPVNLTVRFLLEIIALAAMGAWAKSHLSGVMSYVMMILVPLIAALIWGTFNVKGDPSRSGKAPVPVPGLVRLLIELFFFGFAAWALSHFNSTYGWVFGVITLLHYALSYDRIQWLLER